jgi:hypothetical protein
LLGRFQLFRYEVRRWRGGVIPDAAAAATTVRRMIDVATARRLLDLAPSLPTAVWGRDELGAGEMWNSNSITAWLLVRSGIGLDGFEPPVGGRAPGWRAGAVVAARDTMSPDPRDPSLHGRSTPVNVPHHEVRATASSAPFQASTAAPRSRQRLLQVRRRTVHVDASPTPLMAGDAADPGAGTVAMLPTPADGEVGRAPPVSLPGPTLAS